METPDGAPPGLPPPGLSPRPQEASTGGGFVSISQKSSRRAHPLRFLGEPGSYHAHDNYSVRCEQREAAVSFAKAEEFTPLSGFLSPPPGPSQPRPAVSAPDEEDLLKYHRGNSCPEAMDQAAFNMEDATLAEVVVVVEVATATTELTNMTTITNYGAPRAPR
ncbi:hypothetical protein Aduo_018612 [Ancylostoma duodenale]